MKARKDASEKNGKKRIVEYAWLSAIHCKINDKNGSDSLDVPPSAMPRTISPKKVEPEIKLANKAYKVESNKT